MSKKKTWEKEFDKKVNELRSDLGTKKVYEFGYKHAKGDELHVVVDWGNIKSFISQVLKEREKEIEKGYRKWAKTHLPTWETDNLIHDLMGNPKRPVQLHKPK